jgi:hypothetical protein
VAVTVSKRDSGAVVIPSPDGYHYGDDHSWGEKQRQTLISKLKKAQHEAQKPVTPLRSA